MINEWKLQPANIVIPVLSGVTNNKPFKNLKMTETLKNGIKNVCRNNLCLVFFRLNIKIINLRQQMHLKYGL
jgi:hypothetical protein